MSAQPDQSDPPCAPTLRFPAAITNRPALPRIRYRVGDYASIREALIFALDRAPGLERWTYRGADDPGVALLEGAAIVGDVLTFYQELYANEAFLRTAAWRESVAALVRLTGYRLRPAIGGVATLALELDADAPITAPAGHAFRAELRGVDGPVDLEVVADTVLIPALSKITLCAPQEPQLLADGAAELRLDAIVALRAGDRLLLAEPAADDPSTLSGAQIVVVERAREVHGATVVTLAGGLSLATTKGQLRAYKVRRTLRHFGGNAPPREVSVAGDGAATSAAITYVRSLAATTAASYIDPSLGAREIPLTGAVDDLGVGATVVCEWSYLGFRRARLARVARAAPAAMRWGSLTGNTTLLTLDRPFTGTALGPAAVLDARGEVERRGGAPALDAALDLLKGGAAPASGGGLLLGPVEVYGESLLTPAPGALLSGLQVFDASGVAADIRTFAVHEVEGAAMTAVARPRDRAGRGNEVAFYGPVADARALVGRRLAFTPGDADAPIIARVTAATIVTDAPRGAALHALTLDVAVDYGDLPAEPAEGAAPLVAFANLVDVDQGKSEAEVVLGSGDARQAFQALPLPKAPLTYHRDPAATPPEVPELTVYVQGREWTRVDAFFGRGPDDEVYAVREDDEGRSYVLFGDGKTGARLPSGVDNVTATYRSGAGAYGAQKPATSIQARPIDAVRIKRAHLLGDVHGGAAAESMDNARAAAPGKVQSLDRLVTLADHEAEARAIGGVVRAEARWDLDDGLPVVLVTVLMESGREAELAAVQASLTAAGRCRGPDRAPIVVAPGVVERVHLALRYGLAAGRREADVRPAVAAALGLVEAGVSAGDGLFTAARRAFGGAERASRIEGVVQQVDGVAWCRVVALASLGDQDLEDLSVPPDAGRAEVLAPRSQAHLLALDAGPRGDLVRLICAGQEGGAPCE